MAGPSQQTRQAVRRVRPHPARPHATRLVWDQVVYAITDLWRSRIAFIFTFVFPLLFLVVIGMLEGNATVDAHADVTVMQFVTPAAAVMGALYGSFPTVAAMLAEAREQGILKRLRGAPLPPACYLAGRLIAAALFASAALVLMVAVGVAAYGVDIQWQTLPATVVTVLVAVTAYAAAGVAVAGLARTAALAQSFAIGSAVILSFLSGVMGDGEPPGWAGRIAEVFPVKPFSDALAEQFDPYATGSGWDWAALAVMLAWAVGAVVVARAAFRWDPVPERRTTRARRPAPLAPRSAAAAAAGRALHPTDSGRPGEASLIAGQAWWATRTALHDPGWLFFSIGMPLGLYVFNSASQGDTGSELSPPLELQGTAAMMAWAAMVTAMVNLPEGIARARDRRVLKRLRGTPLRIGDYFAGRFLAALGIIVATDGLMLAVGALGFGLEAAWSGLVLALGVLLLGAAALGAVGLVLASLLPTSRAVTAVGLAVAIVLAFFSDVFVIEDVPGWMSAVGAVFPLKHLANSLSHALDPAGPAVLWVSLAVMAAWLVAGALAATRLFRWEPRG